MNEHPHKEEIIRWANSPKDTKVWIRYDRYCWYLFSTPYWLDNEIYIVNDRHAELRKRWVDEGKPEVEFFDVENGCWKTDTEFAFDVNREYRIKSSEWETPEGVDPILFHAERIDPGWEPDWDNPDQMKCLIMYSFPYKKYEYMPFWNYIYINAVYVSKKAAIKITDALNSGKLKIEKENK